MRFFYWGYIKTMNILIVGNGFDLSHYLPTKYDHFMDAMNVIENKDTGGLPKDLEHRSIDERLRLLNSTFEKRENNEDAKQAITFEELFVETRDPNFLEKTKEFYKTSEIVLTQKSVLEFQYRLAKNCWYQYFKQHVREIKTWIDFEQKIEYALSMVCKFIHKIEISFENLGNCNLPILILEKHSKKENKNYYLSSIECFDLFNLGLLIKNKEYGRQSDFWLDQKYAVIDLNWFNSVEKPEYGFSTEKYINFLNQALKEFIEIFNLYLERIVDKLVAKSQFKIEAESWVMPDHIFSFNYTNTFQKFYTSTSTEFLHGRFGEKQNIVLGISDLEDEGLKKLKAYGFTKYHQKLFKDTDYLFLDDCSQVKKRILGAQPSAMGKGTKFIIWGHSLDQSDQEYIKEIFKLNEVRDTGVRVMVYYFDDNAKFSLLNNLLDILKKDKVEKWMKNGWLTFKENPEVKLVETIPE